MSGADSVATRESVMTADFDAGPPSSGIARKGRRLHAARVLPFLGTVLGSTVLACLIYRPWGGRVSTAMSDGFDVRLHQLYVRNILGGNLYSTDRLGAPFGQHLADFAIGGERVNLLGVRFFGLFTDNVATIINLYFLSTFALVSGTTYLVARRLGLRQRASTVVAVLFTFIPFHFDHGVSHPFLSNYVALPLTFLLATWAMQGSLPVPGRPDWTGSEDHRRKLVWLVVAVLVSGSGGQYFSAFAVLIIAGATLFSLARGWNRRTLLTGLGTSLVVLGVLAANNIHEILWSLSHGANPQVGSRGLIASEKYGLQLAQVLLPGQNGRITPLANLGGAARRIPFPGEPGSYIGLVAILGLAFAVGVMLRQSVGGKRIHDPDNTIPLPLVAAFLTLFCTAVAVVGGLNIVFGVAITPQLRSWDRMAPYLALAGLLSAAWWAEHDVRRLRVATTRLQRTALAGLVIALGLFDQVPRNVAPSNTGLRDHLHSVQQLVSGMDAALPAGAQVFQLPITTFPEAGPTRELEDYSLLEPYLSTSSDLHWSYGGLRGRESDWQLAWGTQPLRPMLEGIASCGFKALYVDRRAYRDGGAGIDRTLGTLGVHSQATSPDGTVRWYDLRSLQQPRSAALVQACRLILHSVVARPGAGFLPVPDPRPDVPRWMEGRAQLQLHNPLEQTRKVTVVIRLRAIGSGTLSISMGDRTWKRRIGGSDVDQVSVTLELPPGDTTLELETDAPIDTDAPRSAIADASTGRLRISWIRTVESGTKAATG